MLALRYAALVALAVWVGGLLTLGAIAAPATFDVLASRGVANSRLVAGAVFGEMLQRAHDLAYVCAGVLLVSLAARRILGPRPVHGVIRGTLACVMLGATLYSDLVVSRRIEAMQQTMGAAPSSLPAGDTRRAQFGRLHATSTVLLLVPVLGGLLLIAWEMKD